ncbi:Uncharacterised protein [Clostridium sporogenes]|nr:Uncharacterised protein [Clostridium sporogenes]
MVALGRDRRRGGRRGRGVRLCRRVARAGASDPAPARRRAADQQRRPSRLPAQSREGRVRDRLLRRQRRRERVFGRAVLQGGAHAGGRALRVAGRKSVRAGQQRADPKPRIEAHRAGRRAMADRDERDAGVSGRDAAGVLRADARDPPRSEDGQAGSGEGEGVLRRAPGSGRVPEVGEGCEAERELRHRKLLRAERVLFRRRGRQAPGGAVARRAGAGGRRRRRRRRDGRGSERAAAGRDAAHRGRCAEVEAAGHAGGARRPGGRRDEGLARAAHDDRRGHARARPRGGAGQRPVPRRELRPDGAAAGDPGVGRSAAGRALGRVCGFVSAAHE